MIQAQIYIYDSEDNNGKGTMFISRKIHRPNGVVEWVFTRQKESKAMSSNAPDLLIFNYNSYEAMIKAAKRVANSKSTINLMNGEGSSLLKDYKMPKKKLSNGGGVGDNIELFEFYDQQPDELRKITKKYEEVHERDEMDYAATAQFLKEVEAIGYTFEYYLDNEPYALRKKGVKVSELKGWEDYDDDEDEYKNGGSIDDAIKHNEAVIKKLKKSGGKRDLEYAVALEEYVESLKNRGSKLNDGGGIGKVSNRLHTVEVMFDNPEYNYQTVVSPNSTEESAREYFVGQSFNVASYPKEQMEKIVDIKFTKNPNIMKDGGKTSGWFSGELSFLNW